MRRGAQSVTCSWPEVECSGVCHDLERAEGFFDGQLIGTWKHGHGEGISGWRKRGARERERGTLLGYPRSRHHSVPT